MLQQMCKATVTNKQYCNSNFIIAADAASQQAAAIVSLEEQQRTQASDADDLLSVMNDMRETLSQQQRAISKLVAKRTRAEERATLAEQRCSEADARIDEHVKLIHELQAQLKDAAISSNCTAPFLIVLIQKHLQCKLHFSRKSLIWMNITNSS